MKAMLVIDVQNAMVDGAHNEAELLAAINRAIDAVRHAEGMVVFIQHCHATFEPMKKGHEGWALHPSLDIESGDRFIEKEASDSFYQSGLDSLLKQESVDEVVVAGLQTEYCVDATCRSALSRGYSVTLVSDGHSTCDSHLGAADIIAHHNEVLGNLAHPQRQIKVKKSNEI